MKTLLTVLAVLLFVIVPAGAFAQAGNASVGGFVQDATQAVIPGVTITATNTQTGVVSKTITNETGTYTILSLLPGSYRLSAELPGFRPHIYNDVQLGTGSSARYNFTLQVGAVSQGIEVTAAQTNVIADSSATIGQVLPQDQVRDLPQIGNDVLDLMRVMGGIRGGAGSEATTFAGISAGMVNTTRDGLSVQDGRYLNGVFGTTVMNPEMVGEMRVILAPVDAEMGRGNGQIQIATRSGTNRYTGSAVWTVRNSALDANLWDNNNDVVKGVWAPTKPNWFNKQEYTVSYGGPVIRNKTFFFALWEQRFENQRTNQRPVVLTDCARNGVFRYYDSWVNGNTDTTPSTTGASATRPVVDSFGNPLQPTTNPGANQDPTVNPFTGQLRYFSVFGKLASNPTKADCSDATLVGGAWDPLRTALDTTGLIRKYLDAMPHANRFDGGDGLNTAVNQWVRGSRSNGSLAIGAGTDTDTDRKQINLKLDHNFNSSNKAAFNYSYEWTDADYALSNWPKGYAGYTARRPVVLTSSVTSTLSANLLNEARFGYRRNQLVIYPAWERPDNEEARTAGLDILINSTQPGAPTFPIAFVPATVGGMTPNSYICQAPSIPGTGCAQQGNSSPLFTYADTLSWVKGKHSYKGGGEARFGNSKGYASPTAPIPQGQGGGGGNPTSAFQNTTNFINLAATNQTLASQLLYFLSGSANVVQQVYFLQNSKDLTKWEDFLTVKRKILDSRENEFAIFFKDDWKVRPSFTLNLGLRYEYYGVPFEGNGLTTAPIGGGLALLGVSGRSLDHWLRPNNGVDLSLVTAPEFVGPKTANPDKSVYNDDWNNWGPAVGFAWQVPWFGAGKTNLRGGYQMTFSGGGRAQPFDNNILTNPGFQSTPSVDRLADGSYMDLRTLPTMVPLTPLERPMQPTPVLKYNQTGSAYDSNYVTPYVQNFTLSLTRKVTSKIDLDLRYIGTRGLKLNGNYNLNIPDVFYNPALFDALTRTRRGEDVELFDQMFMGLNVTGTSGVAPVNGTTQRGSAQLRQNTTFRTALANGDFATVATALDVFNGGTGGIVTGSANGRDRGTVLRRANKGFNVAGGTAIVGGPVIPAGLFPENWISANPQFNAANYYTNSGSSVYHSLQIQSTLRPTHGMSFQGTYLWSRSLGINGAGFTNPAERELDYTLTASHRTHEFRSNGTFELPIGPNRLLLANASGWLARAIERWETSIIMNVATGAPTSITAANMLYANGVADQTTPLDLRTGSARWGDPGASGQLVGSYFASGAFVNTPDPQCAAVATVLQSFCTLRAVKDASGAIVLQNPQPGKRGNIGRQTIENPGSWDFDANIRKSFRITESKSLQLRFDATNIMNHPSPNNPTLLINSTSAFGLIAAKNGNHRQFQGQLRLAF